jgi:ribosomal protein S18 acetylase RimI-like enzyme
MELKIKEASVHDAPSLCKLAADTFYETFKPYNTEEDIQAYIKKAYDVQIISNQLTNTGYYFAVAYINETAAGYIKLIFNQTHVKLSGTTTELEKIYVLKSYWDTKTGAALMQHAIDICKQRGFENLFLGVWQENERAVNFYRKFGFHVFDTRKFQLGSRLCEDYMMVIQLFT